MSYLSERISYLRGLAKGLKIDSSTPDGEMILAIIDVIDDMSVEIDAATEAQDELFDMFEDELDDCDCDCDGECGGCEGCDDMDYFEVQCNNCGNTIYLDEALLDSEDEIECPVCKKKLTIDISELDLEGDN